METGFCKESWVENNKIKSLQISTKTELAIYNY